MRPELERNILKNNPKYYSAFNLMRSIIERQAPDYSILISLYNPKTAEYIRGMIDKFYNTYNPSGITTRMRDKSEFKEIYFARLSLESNSVFKEIQSSLLNFHIPDKTVMSTFFGQYSDSVRKIYGTYLEMQLLRKCELTAASHLNRVAGVSKQLNFDTLGNYKFTAIASMHDTIEDLLMVSRVDGKNVYGIEQYAKFLDDYIPEELQENVKILTNHYNLILTYILRELRKKSQAFIRIRILEELESLRIKQFPEINTYVEKIYFKVLEDKDMDKKDDLLDYLKWECYEKLYLHEIYERAKAADNYLMFETKGLDLFDNAHGREALSQDGKIRNVIKNMMWANYGKLIETDFIPLNNHISECIDENLTYSENLIIKDLLEDQSKMDFFVAALNKIKKLFEVFYITS